MRPDPHVLVTNDDGHAAPGLAALLESVSGLGLRATVVAPLEPMSGASRARYNGVPAPWTRGEPIAGHPVVRVAGTPATCVIFALTSGRVAPVDLCLSGVNAGPNLGSALTASGTYGAVLEAAAFGVPGIALSRSFGAPAAPPCSWDWTWVPRAATQALTCVLSARASWLSANVNLPEHGGDGPPAFTTVSRAPYYRDVYDPERQMVLSEVGYASGALDDGDDIHAFAQQGRTSITLFPSREHPRPG